MLFPIAKKLIIRYKRKVPEACHHDARPICFHVGSCLNVQVRGNQRRSRWGKVVRPEARSFALRQSGHQPSARKTGHVTCHIPTEVLRHICLLRNQGVRKSRGNRRGESLAEMVRAYLLIVYHSRSCGFFQTSEEERFFQTSEDERFRTRPDGRIRSGFRLGFHACRLCASDMQMRASQRDYAMQPI
jgi:hypothetical protein